jgi:hypothetical protein
MTIKYKIAAATVLVGATVAMTSTAYAVPDQGHGVNGTDQSVPAELGGASRTADVLDANRFAVVNSFGQLVRGRNSFSARELSTGNYEVIFDRDIRGCAYNATIGSAGAGNEAEGSITVAQRSGNSFGVFIDIENLDGQQAPRSFHVEVVC